MEISVDDVKIVSEEYLMSKLGLSRSYINKHARAMGVIKRKPRMFFLHEVINFLHEQAERSKMKAMQKEVSKNVRQMQIKKMFEEVQKKNLKEKRR
ncbi:hypothetical protein [Thermodesulfovibrio sp. TK110]